MSSKTPSPSRKEKARMMEIKEKANYHKQNTQKNRKEEPQ